MTPEQQLDSAHRHYQHGDFAQALHLLRTLLRQYPDEAGLLSMAGACAWALGDIASAERDWQLALQQQPAASQIWSNLGVLYKQQQRYQEALSAFQQALSLAPETPGLLLNLGNLYQECGETAAAEQAFMSALERSPDQAAPYVHLATLWQAQQRWSEAEQAYQLALQIAPDDASAHNNLADLYYELGELGAAREHIQACLASAPDHAVARFNQLCYTLPKVASATERPHSLENFLAAVGAWQHWNDSPIRQRASLQATAQNQPFYLAYQPGNLCPALSAYGDVLHQWATDYLSPPTEAAIYPKTPGKIRLAVVSHHFRNHSIWHIVLHGLLQHLDKQRFELILLHTSPEHDPVTAQAAALATRFYPGPCSTQQALDILHQEQPDCIYYPDIGMAPVTTQLACLRLAPLQTASWGQPVTTGLPSIDLYFSGELLEGAETQSHYRERLIRLPGSGACTLDLPAEVQPELDLNALGLEANGAYRFLLCQMPFKFAPEDDELYVRIAQRLPGSEFWLLRHPRTSALFDRLWQRLSQAFTAAGLDPAHHLRELPWLSTGEFYALLDHMDVYLDCPNFSGYTTAWQAVHQGIPIITWEGEFLRQRLAAGLLRQIQQCEGIVHSASEYVQRACDWALASHQQPQRSQQRQTWREAALRHTHDRVDVVRAFEHTLIDTLHSLGAA